MAHPVLSVIVPTFNNESMIGDFFEGIMGQTYPKDCLEVLVLDGGSSDATIEIATSYGATVIHNPDVLAEPGVNRGFGIARGDFLMVLAVDNVYSSADSIDRMIAVFEDQNVYAAFPRHESCAADSIFTKYYNRFTDPFNHFVYGNAANARTFYRVYRTLKHSDEYDVYDFSSGDDVPMIALAQGMTLRAPYERSSSNAFDDCGPIIELIRDGKEMAYVHSVALYHHSVRNLDHFLRKQRWATHNAISGVNYGISHRIDSLSRMQRARRTVWPVYAFFCVPACIRAIVGFISDREPLWLLHPFLSFASAAASLAEVVRHKFRRGVVISRQ